MIHGASGRVGHLRRPQAQDHLMSVKCHRSDFAPIGGYSVMVLYGHLILIEDDFAREKRAPQDLAVMPFGSYLRSFQ